ncbi:uncharacterized protein LOC135201409 isoform X2 [Macrobrachium nipponense]|uniref:uncharacterized protein LOC135201409 isoform X2 n=1 Tax=Macrobrachium nipponense TaxID=159736 RepID=UPI0030C8B470
MSQRQRQEWGFVQTSYFSTDGGGFASGAAESSVIGPDGIKKGECSYTNSNGESFKIKYEEKSNGQIIKGSVNGKEGKQDIERALGECRGSLTKLSGSVQEELEGLRTALPRLIERSRGRWTVSTASRSPLSANRRTSSNRWLTSRKGSLGKNNRS